MSINKKLVAIMSAALLTVSLSSAAFAESAIKLNLNGSAVPDSAAYLSNAGFAHASVEVFAKHYGAKSEWDAKTGVLKLNGTTVAADTYGAAGMHNGTLTAPLRAMTEAMGTTNTAIGWENDSSTVNVAILPEGTIKLTPPVPQMGEHWANPKDMPLGPIYGIYNGKLVFFEYMPAKALDKSVHDVPGNLVPIPAQIDHFDIDWNPEGHEGYEVPHYDMHMYFISRDEQNKIAMPPAGAAPAADAAAPMAAHSH